jgi:hypothetical protein
VQRGSRRFLNTAVHEWTELKITEMMSFAFAGHTPVVRARRDASHACIPHRKRGAAFPLRAHRHDTPRRTGVSGLMIRQGSLPTQLPDDTETEARVALHARFNRYHGKGRVR